MILTITMNPSVDISYPLAQFILDDVNRVDNVRKTAGGKGLNVARVTHLAQEPVIATGLLGGTIGLYIKKALDRDAIQHDFYEIDAESRNCIAILHDDCQTEILEAGPIIGMDEQKAFKNHFAKLLTKVDVITISGSLPKGITCHYYADLIEMAHQQQKKVLLDASGESLQAAINHANPPYLIKPNHEELSQLVGKKLSADNIQGLMTAIKTNDALMNIPMVVVSLGKYGAFAKYHHQFYRATIPKINVINPVGAGDSTLAGLAIGIVKQESIHHILKRAMTYGMLNTMEAQTGYINIENYSGLFDQVEVVELL